MRLKSIGKCVRRMGFCVLGAAGWLTGRQICRRRRST